MRSVRCGFLSVPNKMAQKYRIDSRYIFGFKKKSELFGFVIPDFMDIRLNFAVLYLYSYKFNSTTFLNILLNAIISLG